MRTLGKCTVVLPNCVTFPSRVVIGVRDNVAGRPHGIEANFLQFVATAFEQFPPHASPWPQRPFAADGVNYDGHRIMVRRGAEECRMYIDRNCRITLHAVSVFPDDFASLVDPELLELYLRERPHTTDQLADEVHVRQMEIARERPASQQPHRREKPLYDRPSAAKSLAWIAVGALTVIVGVKWLAGGMARGLAVNFYAWVLTVVGALIIVRRMLDLIFPPSRL